MKQLLPESVFMDNTPGTVIRIRSTMMCLCLLNMEVMSSSHMLDAGAVEALGFLCVFYCG